MEPVDIDAPVSYTFASQKKELLLHNKERNNFVANLRKRDRERRKLRHAKTSIQASVDNVESEFQLSVDFRVTEHAKQFINPDAVNHLSNQADVHTITVLNDSDEGYNGSDEHVRRKCDKSWLHCAVTQQTFDPKYQISEPIPSVSRAGRKFRKAGRKGAYKILLAQEQRTNSDARSEAKAFMQEKLFATKKYQHKDTCHIQRISSNMQVKLNRKLQSRRNI